MCGGFGRDVYFRKTNGTNCGSQDGPTDPGHCHCPTETLRLTGYLPTRGPLSHRTAENH